MYNRWKSLCEMVSNVIIINHHNNKQAKRKQKTKNKQIKKYRKQKTKQTPPNKKKKKANVKFYSLNHSNAYFFHYEIIFDIHTVSYISV